MVFRGQFFDSLPCQEKLLSGAGTRVGAPSFALFAKGGMGRENPQLVHGLFTPINLYRTGHEGMNSYE
jgi:hypothetical protein